jgi:hypothetical protein
LDTECDLRPRPPRSEVGLLAVFASPAVEAAFRKRDFRLDLWLGGFLVVAAMLRVSLLLLADYLHFGVGPAFWLLFAARLLFLLVSAMALVVLRRAASPAVADRLLFAWGLLLVALTVFTLSARPPDSTGLLLMSFGLVVVTYCVAPLPLSRQAALALSYSALALYVSRRADGETLLAAGAAHAMANFFGAVTSWQLNRRRREAFLGELREASLRAGLEEAAEEVRTLRSLLCICAWCKRIRDEAQAWHGLEQYVQSRTHASFSHGICPDCLQSQRAEIDRRRRG